MPTEHDLLDPRKSQLVIIIGIDPHKSTHTAVAVDTGTGEHLGELTINADQPGYQRLRRWLGKVTPVLVAVENARGLGAHLSEWLADEGFAIVDVPTKVARAQRLAGRGGADKNDRADALAAALAAAAGAGDRLPADPNGSLAELMADEREALRTDYTRKRNQFHALLRALRPGGARAGTTLAAMSDVLKSVRPTNPIAAERKRQARTLLVELRRLARQLKDNEARMNDLVTTADSSLPELPGCGPVIAATIMGAVADIKRFASPDSLASFAGAAPREIASAGKGKHRLNRNGNRRLRYALHYMALSQARMRQGPGRAYYLKKRDEGKTHREALRCLKRRLVRAVWRAMRSDATHRPTVALAA